MGQSQSLSHIPDGMCKHCFELRVGHSKGQWKTIWILEGCQEHLALLNSIIFDKIEQNCFGTHWFSGRKLKLSFCFVWMLEKRQDSPLCLITVHGHSPVTWHKKRGVCFCSPQFICAWTKSKVYLYWGLKCGRVLEIKASETELYMEMKIWVGNQAKGFLKNWKTEFSVLLNELSFWCEWKLSPTKG